jgi:hypothetical protein
MLPREAATPKDRRSRSCFRYEDRGPSTCGRLSGEGYALGWRFSRVNLPTQKRDERPEGPLATDDMKLGQLAKGAESGTLPTGSAADFRPAALLLSAPDMELAFLHRRQVADAPPD